MPFCCEARGHIFFNGIQAARPEKCKQDLAARPERAEAPSPGHRPGLLWTQPCRPVRAKALKNRAIYKAFALTIIFALGKIKR